MWLLNAPFDTKEEAGSENKFKLLKSGVSYTLTRAENHPPPCLRVNSKSVSKDHARIQVVKHSEDDVTRLDVVPVLKMTNKRDSKPITVRRAGEDLLLQPLTDMSLKSGDFVVLGRKGITATWQSVVLFWKPSGKELSPATKICALIGMKLSLTFAPVITHHVTATMELSDPHVASLLAGAAPVTKAWIDRVFELAQLPIDGLEDSFLLPDPADYAPPFPATSAAAPWAQQTLWRVADNGQREELFDGIRFLIVSDGPSSPMFCENISRCGGGYDVLDVRDTGADAAAKWDKAISASKKRAGTAKAGLHSALVVVLDEDDIKPAVTRAWGPLVASLNSAGLKYIPSDAVRLAILDRKLKDLDCFYEPAEPENDYVAGTLADEPSQLASAASSQAPVAAAAAAPLPRLRAARKRGTTPAAEDEPAPEPPRRRTRASSAAPEPAPEPPAPAPVTKRRTRATSAAPEPPPPPEPAAEEEAEEDIFAPPKRALRARRTRLASLEVDADGDTSIAAATQPETQLQTQTQAMRPPSRLKRRAGGFSLKIGDDDDDDDSSVPASTGEEPPLKKFKALFDGTEEGWSSKENESFVDLLDSSQSQSQSRAAKTQQTQQARSQKTQSGLGKSQGSGLTAVMEVDEDVSEVSRGLPLTNTAMASSLASSSSLATKRKRGAEDGDVEMADAPPTAKRRATGKENASSSAQEESQAATSLNAASGASKKEKGKTGAVGGVLSAPDKNEKVLTALASLKRGKRTEDAFDREFNALRISRPESDGERRAREEDELFAHFDFDENLRGKKCFEVREYVLPERAERRAAAVQGGGQTAGRGPLGIMKPEWERVPDFKKFKKVVVGAGDRRREQLNSSPSGKAKIELVCPETKDFGMGSAYWSHPGGSQSQSQSQGDESFAATQAGARGKMFMPDFGASDSDEPAPKPKTARAGRSQATQSPKKASQATKKKTPLFIADDDDDDNAMIIDDDAPSTLAATLTQGRGSRSAATSSRSRKPVLEDSDSDDGMTFKSFRKKTSARR